MIFEKTALLGLLLLMPARDKGSVVANLYHDGVHEESNDFLRRLNHRNLKGCISKGASCATDDNCCGATVCSTETLVCCLPEYEKGCDGNDDCCPDLVCHVDSSTCATATTEIDPEARPCSIHGEACDAEGQLECCGDVKYICEESICCFPDVCQKGCTAESHCCGDMTCVDSTCVNSTMTAASCEALDKEEHCLPKSKGPCSSAEECCRNELLCVNAICCLNDTFQGCDKNEDCCYSDCDLASSTCLTVAP